MTPRLRIGSRQSGALAIFALAAMVACAAEAHEYWLAPSSYTAAIHQPVTLGALAGTGFRGERKPFAAPHTVRLAVRASRTLDLTPVARSGDYVWASFAPADDGGALFAYQSDWTPITLPAREFDAYLAKEGLDGPLASRHLSGGEVPGRERFRRAAKAWLAGSDATRATAPVGLPLEIVPLAAPGAASRLPLRVLWQGRPLAGALVRAWRAPLGKDGALLDPEARDSVGVASQARTDARGETTVAVGSNGEWLISVVHMEPSADRTIADWESTWGSLTFVRWTSLTSVRWTSLTSVRSASPVRATDDRAAR